jgi:hypothetical protein
VGGYGAVAVVGTARVVGGLCQKQQNQLGGVMPGCYLDFEGKIKEEPGRLPNFVFHFSCYVFIYLGGFTIQFADMALYACRSNADLKSGHGRWPFPSLAKITSLCSFPVSLETTGIDRWVAVPYVLNFVRVFVSWHNSQESARVFKFNFCAVR